MSDERTKSGTVDSDQLSRTDELQRQADSLEQSSRNLSFYRGVAFIPSLLIAVYTWLDGSSPTGYYVAGAFFVGFLYVAGRHERLLERLEETNLRLRITQQDQKRAAHDFTEFIDTTPVEAIPTRLEPLARDLDLLGPKSLYHWISIAQTPLGRQSLMHWLLHPAVPQEIKLRQQAVSELAAHPEIGEELQVRGRLLAGSPHGVEGFLDWCEGDSWFRNHRWLRTTARTLAIIMAALLLVSLGGMSTPILLAIVAVFLVNSAINFVQLPPVHHVFDSIASKRNEVQQYRAIFELIVNSPESSEKLHQLRERLGESGAAPIHRLDELQRRVNVAAARHSPLLGLPYMVLQYFFLLDFHVLDYLEGWHVKNGSQARIWFDCLAEFEALVSLAGIKISQPGWTYPDVSLEHDRFQATALGHPLIDDNSRVTNDVEIGPAQSFLLVTGSNMSGKSTLLRSVGMNVALAQAGAPTCATELRMPPLQIATSMRVGDSLADGVSFYMAELQRLKQVVDQANDVSHDEHMGLLFLLDEILLGTNSSERHIAVVRVVRHLLDAGAIGAISTHDLELANSPEIANSCRPVHFREHIETEDGNEKMTFDFRMRAGVATTTNALKLLEMVGLADSAKK